MKNSQPYDILLETPDFVLINKHAGIMVHADGRSEEKTLADFILEKYPDVAGVGENERWGIVHRLDRETSGVMIICRTVEAFTKIKNLFKDHKVKKVYHAIVEGNIKNDTGVIDSAIARAKSDFRKKSVVDPYSQDYRGEEREAVTRYKVLARSADKKFTYVEIYPVTGRTHQIRVHMRSIRHPIIGDELYGSKKSLEYASRTVQHSYRLEFTFKNQDFKMLCDEPRDMKETLDKLFKMC